MSMNKGYSKEFQLSLLPADDCCQEGLISEIRYADGSVRQFGYDASGQPIRFVDTDGSTWTRESGSNQWTSANGDSFCGSIEVAPYGSRNAGFIFVRVTDGAFIVSERILFPIGIAVLCHFSRDRTELERHVRLLNGKVLRFSRSGRNALWFRQDGEVAHQPENPCHYGLPWMHPVVALTLA